MNSITRNIYFGNLCNTSRDMFTNLWAYSKINQKILTTDRFSDSNNQCPEKFQFNWLFTFNEGLLIRKSIIDFYRNFFVFKNNSFLSPNVHNLDGCSMEYDKTHLVSIGHLKEHSIPQFLLQEIIASRHISNSARHWDAAHTKDYIIEYYIESLFLTIYKYTMGLYGLYNFDKNYQKVFSVVSKIASGFNRKTLAGVKDLQRMLQPNLRTDTDAGRIEKILQHIRTTLESIEKDINDLRKPIKPDTVAKEATGQTVEEEYISNPAYYRYKRHVAIFKEKIEQLYENIDNDLEQGRYVYRRLLKNYQRIVPLDNPQSPNGVNGTNLTESLIVETNYSVNFKKHRIRTGEERQTTGCSSFGKKAVSIRIMQLIDLFRVNYIKSKQRF